MVVIVSTMDDDSDSQTDTNIQDEIETEEENGIKTLNENQLEDSLFKILASTSINSTESKSREFNPNDLEEIEPPDPDSNQVIKSASDPRVYETFVLENKLRVLAISEVNTTKCAAALSIQAGSLLDPKELPGLAHLCQRMITMGGDNKEDNFKNFILTHGGDYNEITNKDSTIFSFDISSTHFDSALSQFAQLFMTNFSSFTDDEIEKGIKQVDQEFEKNLPSDDQRRTRVEQFCSSIDHPYRQFDCGNTLSLWTRPQTSSIDLREFLVKFYKKNYSGNLMYLVVLGHRSCAELQILIEDFFGGIQNVDTKISVWSSPYDVDQFKTKIELVPIVDIGRLLLIFPTPDYTQEYRTGLITYMEYILGHKCPGSLLALLREQNWSRQLKTQYKVPGRGFGFFTIEFELTPSGLKNIYNVAHHVFQYFKMLSLEGPQRWLWNELSFLRDAKFKFLNKEPPLQYVEKLINSIPNYPCHHYLIGNYLMKDYKPKLIRQFIDELTPTKLRMIVSTKQNDRIANQTEQWYGIKYKYSEIDQEHIEKWTNCVLHDDLRFPSPNQFLPNSFQLKPRDFKSQGMTPRIIEDNSMSCVWFLQDTEFNVPTATIILYIQSPLPKQKAAYFNSIRLIEKVMMDSLIETTCDAKNAGLISKIEATLEGLTITTHGYDDKLPKFFDCILSKLFHVCSVGEVGKRYEDMKDEYIQQLTGWREEEPYIQAVEYIWELLNVHTWSPHQLLQAMIADDVSSFHLMTFCQQFLAQVKLIWVFHGNLTEAEALEIYNSSLKYFELLGSQPPSSNKFMTSQEFFLPSQTRTAFNAEHPTHCDSCTVILLQTGDGALIDTVMTELIESLIKEPALQFLKTEEQIVWTEVRRSRNTLGIQIILQEEKDPSELENRIEQFLYNMETQLEGMKEDQLNQFRRALIDRKLEQPNSMNNRSLMIFDEILRDNNFQRQTQEILELGKILLKDVVQFYKERITPNGIKRKKLCVQVTSTIERDSIVLLQSNSTDATNPNLESKSVEFKQLTTPQNPQSDLNSLEISINPTSKMGAHETLDISIPSQSRTKFQKIQKCNQQISIMKKSLSLNETLKNSIEKKQQPSIRTSFLGKSPKILATPSPGVQSGSFIKISNPSSGTGQIQRPKTVIPNESLSRPQNQFRPRTAVTTTGSVGLKQSSLKNQNQNQKQRLKENLLQNYNNISQKLKQTNPKQDDFLNLKLTSQVNKSLGENSVIAKSSVTTRNLSFTERPPTNPHRQLQKSKQIFDLKIDPGVKPNSNLVGFLPSKKYQTPRSIIYPFEDNQKNKKNSNLYPNYVQQSPYNCGRAVSKTMAMLTNKQSKSNVPSTSGPTSSNMNENSDFRDYEFDFDEEIKRLKNLKKVLHHQEEQKMRSNLNPNELETDSQKIIVGHRTIEMMPGFNLQTEILRVKNMKKIFDEEIFKPISFTRFYPSNSLTPRPNFLSQKNSLIRTQSSKGSKVNEGQKQNEFITVHDVEKEIQRLKNIKKYLDGDTKELKLHNVEYTVFVVSKIDLNDNKGAQALISRYLTSSSKAKTSSHKTGLGASFPLDRASHIVTLSHHPDQSGTGSASASLNISNFPQIQFVHTTNSNFVNQSGQGISTQTGTKLRSISFQPSNHIEVSKSLKKSLDQNVSSKLLRDLAVKQMKRYPNVKVNQRNSEMIVLKKRFDPSRSISQQISDLQIKSTSTSKDSNNFKKLKPDTNFHDSEGGTKSPVSSSKLYKLNSLRHISPNGSSPRKVTKMNVPLHFSSHKSSWSKKHKVGSSIKMKIPFETKSTAINLNGSEGGKKMKSQIKINKVDSLNVNSNSKRNVNLIRKLDPKSFQRPMIIDETLRKLGSTVMKIKLEGKVTTINLKNMEQIPPQSSENAKNSQILENLEPQTKKLSNGSNGKAELFEFESSKGFKIELLTNTIKEHQDKKDLNGEINLTENSELISLNPVEHSNRKIVDGITGSRMDQNESKVQQDLFMEETLKNPSKIQDDIQIDPSEVKKVKMNSTKMPSQSQVQIQNSRRRDSFKKLKVEKNYKLHKQNFQNSKMKLENKKKIKMSKILTKYPQPLSQFFKKNYYLDDFTNLKFNQNNKKSQNFNSKKSNWSKKSTKSFTVPPPKFSKSLTMALLNSDEDESIPVSEQKSLENLQQNNSEFLTSVSTSETPTTAVPSNLSSARPSLTKIKLNAFKMANKKKTDKKIVISKEQGENDGAEGSSSNLRNWMNQIASNEMTACIKSLTHKATKKVKQYSAHPTLSFSPVFYHPPSFPSIPIATMTHEESQRLKEWQNLKETRDVNDKNFDLDLKAPLLMSRPGNPISGPSHLSNRSISNENLNG